MNLLIVLLIDGEHILPMFVVFVLLCMFVVSSWSSSLTGDECEILTMCKCSNFPLFTLIDTSYLSKPRSLTNQDLFCTYAYDQTNEMLSVATFDQFKYSYYRFRTLTLANYPNVPTRAFRFVRFETQNVKQMHKVNNRNVIALVNVERTQPGMFEELTLSDAQDQLAISFLNSPSLIYTDGALSNLACHDLKLLNTNPRIPMDFFRNSSFIHHLIIDNPSFTGFLPSSNPVTIQLSKLTLKHISVRHLRGKHFPIIFNSVTELSLENRRSANGLRSLHSLELSRQFPRLLSLTLFSQSIQHILGRMFEYFDRLEYLFLDGITTIENEAFANLYHLKELHLGRNLLRIDSLAFIQMNTHLLILNQSEQFRLNDEQHFCTFASLAPLINMKTLVQFASDQGEYCSCTIRYLYRHLDKSLMSNTPRCYSNSNMYILAQEERLCRFDERLLACDVLPDEGITIYGKHYNTSYFYDQQPSKRQHQFRLLRRYRIYIFALMPVFIIGLCLVVLIVRQQKQNGGAYRHLNRLLQRSRIPRDDVVTSTTMDIIYHRTTNGLDFVPTAPVASKV